jgi:hypothetical protein
MRSFIILLLNMFASVVGAAEASILVAEIQPGIYYGLDLETGLTRTILYHKLGVPNPPPLPDTGLHVLILDDENLRGSLPQAQINIFTSTELAGWLDANCVKAADGQPAYRFSSNDSLAEGTPARKLELKVWVDGWDAVMKAVADKKVTLPAWAISNGKKGVIEELPANIAACLKRLKEFKE